jgi:DNA-binding NtrC family response regulator
MKGRREEHLSRGNPAIIRPELPQTSDLTRLECEIFPVMQKNSPTLRVLLVEDETLIRWSVAETLAHAGHTVLEACDAATAVRAVVETAEPIDVVLLDFRLPDSNDLTLLSTIRRLTPRSSVILMTAYGTPEIIKGALELGVYRVLSKPIDMHDIGPLMLQAHGSRRQ